MNRNFEMCLFSRLLTICLIFINYILLLKIRGLAINVDFEKCLYNAGYIILYYNRHTAVTDRNPQAIFIFDTYFYVKFFNCSFQFGWIFSGKFNIFCLKCFKTVV